MEPAVLVGLVLIGIVLLLLLAAACSAAPLSAAERRAGLRAEALLREMLSPREYAQLEEHGYLEVPSRSSPGRVYRIPVGSGPVSVVENDTILVRLCLQPVHPVPQREVVLAHKAFLEAAEDEYWRQANILGPWPGRRHPNAL